MHYTRGKARLHTSPRSGLRGQAIHPIGNSLKERLVDARDLAHQRGLLGVDLSHLRRVDALSAALGQHLLTGALETVRGALLLSGGCASKQASG